MSEEQNNGEPRITGKELTVANEYMHALQPYGPVKALREMTRRIMSLDTGKIKMTAPEAAHLAQMACSSELNPFTGEIWGWPAVRPNGERTFTVMPGRKGLLRHARDQADRRGTTFWPEYEQLTDPNVRADNYVPEGALAFKCYLRDAKHIEAWNKAMNTIIDAVNAGIDVDTKGVRSMPYTPGLGILTKKEMADLDKSGRNKMTHVERCQKRAYMAALKQSYDLPLAANMGGAGETIDDYVLDAEWRELSPEEEEEVKERSEAGKDALFGEDGGARSNDDPQPIQQKTDRSKKRPVQWEESTIKQIRKHPYFPNNAHSNRIRATLNLTPFNEDMPIEWIERWITHYEKRRARNSDAELPSNLAAEAATADWKLAYADNDDAVAAFGEEFFLLEEA